MKNWIKCIIIAAFLVVALPVFVPAAEGGKGILAAEGNRVSVSLHLPEGQTETITSLRVKLSVTVVNGEIAEPAFRFNGSLKSAIKEVFVSKEGSNVYLVEIILSGKKEQDIFEKSADVFLGELTASPLSQEYEARVEFAGAGGADGGPAVGYMDAGGIEEMTALIEDADAVTLVQKADNLFSNEKPKLKTGVKKGSKSIIFEWQKINGASGYELYQYNAKTKQYKRIHTVSNGSVTAYSKKFSYAVTYSFKLRAYWTAADGGVLYGPYSSVAKVTVPPATVKGLALKKSGSKGKASLSWKKVSGAKGYQIYRSKKKSGKYKLLKTIKKGSAKKYSVKKPSGKTVYYYKVRAYVTNAKGKRVYGNFSKAKS